MSRGWAGGAGILNRALQKFAEDPERQVSESLPESCLLTSASQKQLERLPLLAAAAPGLAASLSVILLVGCTVLEPLQAGTHAAGLSALPACSDLSLHSEMNLGSSMPPSARSQHSPTWVDANGPPSLAAPTLYFLGPLLVQILLEITVIPFSPPCFAV